MRGTECLLRFEGILFLLLRVYSAYTDDFKVEVPVEPVSARVGSSVLLPCRISTGVSAVDMDVRWMRNGDEIVHVYATRADLEGRQSPRFKGRTHLDREPLGSGNVSLQLNDVRVSDEGSYQCYVVSKSWFADSCLLKSKVSGTDGNIHGSVSAVDMDVRWMRNGDEIVHVYATRADLEGRQSPRFKGRTHLDREPLGSGNVSLQLNDLCQYYFTLPPLPPLFLPAALGSSPRFTVAGRQDSSITLQCDSEGWFPKPELQWRSVKGADLTGRAVLTEKPGPDGLFTLQSTLQISEQEADEIICLIRHGEEKRVLQTRIHIDGEFFTLVAPWWKGLSVFFIVCLALFVLCILVAMSYYRKREATKEIKRQSLVAECDDLRKEIKSKGFVLKSEWKEILDDSVAVTLDPDTAHCRLTVSEDGKRVRNDFKDKSVPNTEWRFIHYHFVLGREGFTSGRHYWEVEVGKRNNWKLGVASESAKRKGRVDLSPKEGYWVLQLLNGHDISALVDPENPLKLLPPLKVGVHLNYEEGKLSFYRVEDRCAIYTFLGKFSGELFPLFDPGEEGEELVILNKQDQSDNSVSLKMGPSNTGCDSFLLQV
ncbi:butyrophilin-like protein 9 [Polyodon spathula]|uniref:butyrophilin-like protein 9 n=1 Tax=Polyodon spathula TaxID=7913 RepID=UPI001B7DF93B|nr:butyrophilin-like protein 9 [Polyodon spathula]